MLSLYQKNRQRLMQVHKDGLIVLTAAKEILRNGDVNYRYRQDSYFLYLTGITKPHHSLILDPKSKKSHLFIPDLNDHHRIWVGKQLTTREAKKLYKFDYVHYNSERVPFLKKIARKYRHLYTLSSARKIIKKPPSNLNHNKNKLKLSLDKLRLYKTPEEIKMIQKANKISHHGHIAAMKSTRPGIYEFQIQSEMEQKFLKSGAFHLAYDSIVASGQNAATLHYVDNNSKCQSGRLLLIDAGCEWLGYASDISRTLPVSGKFSKKQKDIYDIVIKTQKACIRMVKPGVSLLDIHEQSGKLILQGLMDIGILEKGDVNKYYKKEVHRIFYPHGVGHLLGLDVHDVGPGKKKYYRKSAKNLRSVLTLDANMVITIEPGIYFISAFFDSQATRKKYKNYVNWRKADAYRSIGGIRIEDDILVTKKGYENLTTVPKEIKDIERIMGGVKD